MYLAGGITMSSSPFSRSLQAHREASKKQREVLELLLAEDFLVEPSPQLHGDVVTGENSNDQRTPAPSSTGHAAAYTNEILEADRALNVESQYSENPEKAECSEHDEGDEYSQETENSFGDGKEGSNFDDKVSDFDRLLLNRFFLNFAIYKNIHLPSILSCDPAIFCDQGLHACRRCRMLGSKYHPVRNAIISLSFSKKC